MKGRLSNLISIALQIIAQCLTHNYIEYIFVDILIKEGVCIKLYNAVLVQAYGLMHKLATRWCQDLIRKQPLWKTSELQHNSAVSVTGMMVYEVTDQLLFPLLGQTHPTKILAWKGSEL